MALAAVMVLVAALAGTGVAAFSRHGSSILPWDRFSLEYAEHTPCWSGAIKLRVAPSVAHVGEVLTLDPVGAPFRGLMGGVLTTLEAPSPKGWSAAYFLSTYPSPLVGLNATPATAGYLRTLQGFYGPLHARAPDVPSGTYRLVGSYSPSDASLPRDVNLCAALKVLPTSKMLTGADHLGVEVSPSARLRNGERVRVSLSGFGHSATVGLFECAFESLATSQGCGTELDDKRPVHANPNGSATTTVVVHGYADAGPGSEHGHVYPCLDNCVLVATLGNGYASAGTELSFRGRTGAFGTLEVSGPSRAALRRVPGHVIFEALDDGGRRYSASTASDGEFALLLAPGRYRPTGYSPGINSGGGPMKCTAYPPVVTVRPGQMINTLVTCNIK